MSSPNSTYYVYQHKRLDNNQVFYVGRGTSDRISKKTDRNKHWHNIVNKHGYSMEYLIKGIDKEFADLCEIEAISIYRNRGVNLANVSAGGDGGLAGISLSKEHRQKLSDSHIGLFSDEKHPMARKVLCVETGIVYDTLKFAIQWLKSIGFEKASMGNLSSVCRGHRDRPKAYGYTWKYYTEN